MMPGRFRGSTGPPRQICCGFRARAGAADISGYLNDLVGRAYALTYPGKRVRLAEIGRFLSMGFPDVLAREWRMFVASFLLFWAGAGFGWIGMMFDPDAAPYLVPDQHQTLDPEKRKEEEAKNKGASSGQQAAFLEFLVHAQHPGRGSSRSRSA